MKLQALNQVKYLQIIISYFAWNLLRFKRGGSHNATPALFRCGMFATGVMALSPFPCCCVSTGVVTHVSPTTGVVTCCIKKKLRTPPNIDLSLINFNSQTNQQIHFYPSHSPKSTHHHFHTNRTKKKNKLNDLRIFSC